MFLLKLVFDVCHIIVGVLIYYIFCIFDFMYVQNKILRRFSLLYAFLKQGFDVFCFFVVKILVGFGLFFFNVRLIIGLWLYRTHIMIVGTFVAIGVFFRSVYLYVHNLILFQEQRRKIHYKIVIQRMYERLAELKSKRKKSLIKW